MAAGPARRSFVEIAGWGLASVGLGAVGFAIVRSVQPAGTDSRVRVDLPERPDRFLQRVAVDGRSVGVIGLSAMDSARLGRAPGAPPFTVVDLACPNDRCLVALARDATEQLICPCCGSVFSLEGARLSGPARRNLAVPPYSVLGRTAVLIGNPFQAS